MDDHKYLHDVMIEATQYRMLRNVFQHDPESVPRQMRDIFLSGRDSHRMLERMASANITKK